ncbi:hypothetical protein ACFV2S_25520 [Streptomyces sp. NPDC059695]|uniref:hypothetical protein n=1 Tax=Streptomyces sp. NPDC059695 TaxID=3346910 RepID=UPI0036B32D78
MSITTLSARIGAVAAAGAALAVLGSGSAFAGGNGQQLRFYDTAGRTYSIQVAGWNQNGEYTTACFGTPVKDNYLGGWWWKGDLHWVGYRNAGCSGEVTVSERQDYVEPNQADDWWFLHS